MTRMLIITPCRARVGERGLHAGRHWARDTDTAHSASYAGEHAAEFTLNPGLAGRALQLGLRALDCLRQRRYPSFAVDLLNAQKPSRMPSRMRSLVHHTWAARLKGSSTGSAIVRH